MPQDSALGPLFFATHIISLAPIHWRLSCTCYSLTSPCSQHESDIHQDKEMVGCRERCEHLSPWSCWCASYCRHDWILVTLVSGLYEIFANSYTIFVLLQALLDILILPIFVSFLLFIYLFIHLSIYLFIHLFDYLMLLGLGRLDIWLRSVWGVYLVQNHEACEHNVKEKVHLPNLI